MTPQDLYSVAIRIIGLTMAASSVALCLTPIMGILGYLVVGLVLLFVAGPLAGLTYRRPASRIHAFESSPSP